MANEGIDLATNTPQAHVADPAACAAQTSSAVGDLVATNNGWGASSEANFDAIHTAIDAIVTDIGALKTAIDANNSAIDSILTALEGVGILLTS